MLAEIVRLRDAADAIDNTRVRPHEGEFHEIMRRDGWDAVGPLRRPMAAMRLSRN